MLKYMWQTGEGKPVEVNQRALIHKILARYPGQFTLFRELLQNSDDAQSSTVEIHFEAATSRKAGIDPQRSLIVMSSHAVRWTFKNDGRSFTSQDWARLAKIAEGNPDPGTVGTFGVGFYSLFSVTDRPSVLSGGKGVEFYWRDDKDQLHIRQGDLPSEQTTCRGTIIEIPLREPSPIPLMIDFARFLATSITFMVYLKDIRVFFDGHHIAHIRKLPELTEVLDLPIALEHSSPKKTMVVDGIQYHRFAIQVEVSIETLESSLTDIPKSCEDRISLQTGVSMRPYTAKLGLTVFTAEVDVKVNESLSRELIRCTAKKPPSRLKYSLVYTGKEEYDLSPTKLENSIFQGLRADLNGALHPRIFIGHSTSQTTGLGGHMASSFIPTVERESIDLVNVPIWNSELLYIGGFLSRVVYELELSAIQTLWEGATERTSTSDFRPSLEFQERLFQRFLHVLKFFTFHHSTPSSRVGKLLQESFYACSTLPLRFLSSVGIRYASDIRVFNQYCAKFLKHVPMLSQDVTHVGEGIIKALPDEHNIRIVALSDVLQDLCQHTLDVEELVACLQWQLHHGLAAGMAELWQVVHFEGADGTRIKLSSIQYFIDSDGLGPQIPLIGPLPSSLIPPNVTKDFTLTGLESFEIMSTDPRYDFTRSIDWAETVLSFVSSAWSSSDEIRHLAKSVFANKSCIPIFDGLRRAEDSYLPSKNILAFDDLHLPVVRFPSGLEISPEMESLLLAVGVRRHLPPRLLLTRMIEMREWNSPDLIDHLIQTADTLSSKEISELKSEVIFVKENVRQCASKTFFRADELYAPLISFRQLHLPLIEWGKWRDESSEEKHLALKPNSSIAWDAAVRTNAFAYLCTNLRSVYSGYNPVNFRHIAFVPAEKIRGPCLEKLGNVFLGDQWKTLGFSVIRHRHWEDVIKELGVQRHPSASLLLHLLETEPPSNEEIARAWFEILAEHVPSFAPLDLERLSRFSMVPKTISGQRTWLAPVQCYLGRSSKYDFYSKLFHYVNFGPKANHFLRHCGAMNEPSEKDVAESLIDNPERFYELTGGHERFLQEVGDLASRHTRIPNSTVSKMRSEPVLLGVRRETTSSPERWETIYLLQEPREIVIVDDIHAYQLFGDSIIAAPRDMPPELERFYVLLGCQYLSTAVSEQCNESREIHDTETCSKFRTLVLQRLPLFLHHYPSHQPGTLASRSFSRDDIVVRLWERLSISKTFHLGNTTTTKEQDVWATAKFEEARLQLWLSHSGKQDLYEIAICLCRVLFNAVKLSDALLLTTILSEDLDILRRRGYEVDQVLKRQHDINQSESGLTDTASSSCLIAPEIITTQHGGEAAPGSLTSSLQVPLSVTNMMNNVRDAFRVATRSIVPTVEPSGTVTAVLPPAPWAPRQVMPRSYIQSNVSRAIAVCNSGERMPLHHHNHADVDNFLNNGYCDVTEPIGHLRFLARSRLGKMDNVDVYIGQDTPNAETFMERMHEPLTHFICIILQIAKIYIVPPESLRVFWDDAAGCIAFNCKGILYLNLRYFEAWHYQDVKHGRPHRALSSWFLTLAHELAHNLVTRHDSEHAFWSSAICEAHIIEFSQLLGTASSV
ncbi:hypothetical protein OG21DRAFT_1483894 [Imleria badia]|nr:hypothetical protein OG21DRAFT_1483894 [Imleria badia]